MSGLSCVIWNLFGSYYHTSQLVKIQDHFFNNSSFSWIFEKQLKTKLISYDLCLMKSFFEKVQFVVRTKRNDINEKNDSLYGQWKYVIQFTCKLGSWLMKAVICCFYFWISLNLFLSLKVFHALLRNSLSSIIEFNEIEKNYG